MKHTLILGPSSAISICQASASPKLLDVSHDMFVANSTLSPSFSVRKFEICSIVCCQKSLIPNPMYWSNNSKLHGTGTCDPRHPIEDFWILDLQFWISWISSLESLGFPWISGVESRDGGMMTPGSASISGHGCDSGNDFSLENFT